MISADLAYEIAKDAYVYAYPLVLRSLTQRQRTNFAEPTGVPGEAPYNQFTHARAFAPIDFKVSARASRDTLASVAHLDLGPEPVLLDIPATDRYFVLVIASLWGDVFAAPGTRTTGANTARRFLLVTPKWQGGAPSDVDIIQCPTRYATITGYTHASGPSDYNNAHRVQNGFALTTLSSLGAADPRPLWGKVDPTIDMHASPFTQIATMGASQFFRQFADLLTENPAGPQDYPMLHRLDRIGFSPGRPFDLRSAHVEIRDACDRAINDGRALIANLERRAHGHGVRGWSFARTGGSFGVDYRERASAACSPIVTCLPQDAIYPSVCADDNGRPLDGRSNYVLHFDSGRLPPVDAFWSITAYDADGYFIPNGIHRQALTARDAFAANTDGSLDVYVCADSPGRRLETNWLPVARAPFMLLMRLYWPRVDVLDGTWTPPSLRSGSGRRRRRLIERFVIREPTEIATEH